MTVSIINDWATKSFVTSGYVKLDQTTPQTVSGGRPTFSGGIEFLTSTITGGGAENIFHVSETSTGDFVFITPGNFRVEADVKIEGYLEPQGEDPWTIGLIGNRWSNVFSTNLDSTGTASLNNITSTGLFTLGTGTLQTANFNWDCATYQLEIDLTGVGSTFVLTNPTGFSLGLASSVATSSKVATFQNVTGTVYISTGTDVTVADGGTGRSSHTAYALIAGGTTTTAAQQSIANSASSNFPLVSKGTSAVPGWGTVAYPTAATSGQLACATALNALGFNTSLLWSEPTFTIGSAKADTDYALKFDGETSDGTITYMEDESQFKFDQIILALNKISFTQVDNNEYIDSLADGYLDIYATTGVRFGIGVTEQINLIDGVFQPKTTNDIDLGTTALFFKDSYLGRVYLENTSTYLDNNGGDIDVYSAANKTIELQTVVYDDIRINSGNISRPGGSDPAWRAYDVNGGGVSTYLLEFGLNKYGTFTVQIPHGYKTGQDIKVHLHWTAGANGAGEDTHMVGWKVQYSWANIEGAFPTMTTADLSDEVEGTNHLHQMTPEATIDGHTAPAKGISSMLICNVIRTDTGADDTWVGTAAGALPMLLEVDFHFPIDTIGSRDWGTK
jgi:hypothetical protein